jgi:hypothetical protein
MDNLEQQIEARLNELSDNELNKLAIHLKVPRAHEGIQAPLGVKVSDLQKINFIKWIKKTGNIEKVGIYLGTIEKSELPRKELSKQQRTIETAKSQTRTDRVINLVKDHRLISIIVLLGVLIIAIGTVLEKFDSIINFWQKIAGQKLEISTKDDFVNSMGRTPMYARTRKKVDELEHMLIDDKITPWRLLPTGKPIEITDYYGKTLHLEGVAFSGSVRTGFWGNFIEPFIENGIIEVLDATAEECRSNNLEPKPYLEEAARLLAFMISKVYEYMAETEKRLLGMSHQERRDVSDKISKMNQILEEHKKAALLLFSESNQLKAK